MLGSPTLPAAPARSPRAPAGAGRGAGRRLAPAAAALALAGAALLATLSLLRHARHDTYAHDLGLLAQVAFNTLQGRWYETTLVGGNYLGEHFSPALALVAPLYLIWPDARVLLVLQALALGAGGWIVWLGARDRFGTAPAGLAGAFAIQIAYFLMPSLAWVARAEFHQIALAVPFLALAGRAFLAGRSGPAAGWAAAALLANEDAALAVGGVGLSLLAIRRWRSGLALLALAGVWLGGYLFWIAPAVRARSALADVPPTVFGAFADLGTDQRSVARAILANPIGFLGRAFGPGRPAAWLAVVGPTVGLGLLSPLALSWLPTFLLIVLGAAPDRYRQHYVAPLLPLIAFATVDAIDRLRRRFAWSPLAPAGVVLAAALAVAAWGSPLPGGGAFDPAWYARRPHDDVLDRAIALVPRDPSVAVSASTEIVAHLALRRDIWLFPGRPSDTRFIVADTLGSPYPLPSGEEFRRALAIARSDPAFETIFDEDGVTVLRRRPDPPARSLSSDFGGRIRLIDAQAQRDGDQSVKVALTWEAIAPPDRDYTRFIHVFAPDGRQVSQLDGQPVDNQYPTGQWTQGRLVREELTLPLSPEAPPGTPLHITIGWYDLATLDRLPRPEGGTEYTLEIP